MIFIHLERPENMKKSSTPGLSKALKTFLVISIICILSLDLVYGFYIYADNKDDPSKSLYHRFYQETENSLDGLYAQEGRKGEHYHSIKSVVLFPPFFVNNRLRL